MKVIGIVIILVFIGILVMQVMMYLGSQKMKGRPVPADLDQLLRRSDAAGSARSLVYFYSPSCGPCRSMTPVIDKLAGDGRPVFKINIQDSPEIASKIGIRATPTLLVINQGLIEKVMLGAQSEQKLSGFLTR